MRMAGETKEDLSNHPSFKNIVNANKDKHGYFRFKLLRSNQVQSALEKLNVRKAIAPKMLKLASSGMAHAVTKLYNESIQKGEWPEAWKKASGSVGKKG